MTAPAARAALDIRRDDLSGEAMQSLLRLHLAAMHANSPPGSAFALDLTGLQASSVTLLERLDRGCAGGNGRVEGARPRAR